MSSRSGCCVALLLAALCVMGCTAQDSNAPKAPPSPDVPSSPISLPGEEPKPKPAAPEPLGSVEYIKVCSSFRVWTSDIIAVHAACHRK